MNTDAPIRELLARMLAWEDAHVGFDTAVANIPTALRSKRPPGGPYSPWELVEHLRRTQHDILDFCRNAQYKELEWPAAYWPSSPGPASDAEWDKSIEQFHKDRKALQELAADRTIDLTAKIPHGQGQTYLRELVLVADHTSYHVGQLVLVRRLLGNWK